MRRVVDLADDRDHVARRERRGPAGGGAGDTGQRLQALEERPAKDDGPGAVVVADARGIEAEGQHARRIEARLESREAGEAPRQQAGAHQEDQGQGDLHRHEQAARGQTPAPAVAGHGSGAALLEGRREIVPRRVERGRHAEEQPGHERNAQREEQDARIEHDRREAEQKGRVADSDRPFEARQRFDAPEREEDARDAAGQGKHEAFGQELTHDPPPRRPDGHADRDFAAARAKRGPTGARPRWRKRSEGRR